MSVNVSKFAKKKENSSSVTVNNNSRGYSNTNNYSNVNTSGLDRMLWNIHDTGQDITGSLEIPQLSVNGRINATGIIHSNSEVSGPIGRFSYIYDCTEGHIDKLYSDHIDTQTLKVHDTADITYLNSDRITTHYLDVTKSAHFAELVIDKIKSVGGSAVFSPADGFKLNTEDDIRWIYEIKNDKPVLTKYCMLCWDAEDDRGKTVNMWEIGDQALCQNFNEANEGTSYNVSNTYYWMLVRGKGTYDPNANTPEKIQYDRGSSAADTSNYMTDAYDSKGNLITFETPKHYIIVYNYPALYTDAENKTYVQMTGSFEPKPGQDIVMLGHRAQTDELKIERNQKYPNFKKRQSAIYIAAYNSTIEPDLMAPLIAQYEGINDFDLSSHRTTHFAAGHNDIFGYDNVIKGSFKTINGTDITDLTGVTYFIKTDKAYVPVTSDYSLDSSFDINIDCMYISGDSGPLYVGNKNSNMRLIVRYSRGNTSKSKTVSDTEIKGTYTLNLGQIIAPQTVLSGKIDSLSFEIAEYVDATVGYNTLYQYNMPVIQLPDNVSYTNTELSKLNPMIELAQVDVEGNFALYLQYQVQYIIGNTVTNVDDTDYSVQFVIWDEDNNREHTKIIPYNSTKGCFEYNKSTQDNYEKTNVFGTYGGRSLLHDQYIEVSLIKNNGSVMVDKRIIPITLVAGAMFSVTDSITSRVTANETTANTALNMASEAKQTAEGFDQRVTKTETDINNQKDTITGLQTDISRIQQTADSITSEVAKISGVGGENLLVNSCFQVSEENDLPEKWDYYNTNTIVKCESEGSLNYVNINNNKDQPNTNDGKYRGIQQTTQDRFDTAVQDFYPNHIYCFSFYGKKNSTYGEISCFIHYLDNTGTHFSAQGQYQDQTYCDFDLTDDWQRYTFIFKTPNNNIIYSFNILLEYYGNIKRGTETSIPVRDNDVDIMIPMLLDFGTATNERMDMYGLYSLSGEDHIYDKWINTEYNINSVPRWQGNSQDVSVSSSQIEQTAELIRAQVGDCGINITDKKITLNGNTEINGSLNIYNSYTGFILNGSEGMTQITADSVGDYDSFKARSNTTINKIETTAGTYASSTGRYITNNYAFRIYLGKYKKGKTITFNSMSHKFYTNTNSDITGNMVHSRTVKIEDSYNGKDTKTTTKTFGSFTYTVQNTDADIYLFVELSIGHPISAYGPISQIGYCDLTVNYTIPNDAFTLIGYDGIGMNFGTSANVYFNKDNTILRYGSSGLRVSVDGVTKWNGSEWVNLNTPSIKKLNRTEYSFNWENSLYDMVITTANDGENVKIKLPTGPYIGRTVYIRKRGSKNIEVRAGNDIMKAWDTTNSSDIIDKNEYLPIENGREYKFTFDGEYWLANRMDNA